MSYNEKNYRIAQIIIFSLLFMFYAFMTFVVSKKGDKIIIMMLICLSLGAIGRVAEFIFYMINEPESMSND